MFCVGVMGFWASSRKVIKLRSTQNLLADALQELSDFGQSIKAIKVLIILQLITGFK